MIKNRKKVNLVGVGGVAQLVRASACHAEGRESESRRPRKLNDVRTNVVFFVLVLSATLERRVKPHLD